MVGESAFYILSYCLRVLVLTSRASVNITNNRKLHQLKVWKLYVIVRALCNIKLLYKGTVSIAMGATFHNTYDYHLTVPSDCYVRYRQIPSTTCIVINKGFLAETGSSHGGSDMFLSKTRKLPTTITQVFCTKYSKERICTDSSTYCTECK